MGEHITRRNFLIGGIAAGTLAASAGLISCSPAEKSSSTADDGKQGIQQGDKQPWEISPEDISESKISETIEQDVVIIGLGASGIYAATSAVENGLKVTILERNETFNANGGSHFVFNSAPQRELGQEVDTALAVKDFLNIANNKVDGNAVWEWANKSGEAADWFAGIVKPYGLRPVLQQSDNEEITRTYPGTILFIGGKNEPTSGIDNDPYNGDLGLGFVPEIDILGALCEHLKSKKVNIQVKHKSERLIKNSDGRITGVVAIDSDGVYKKFVATKGVVIATGTYDQDPDMHAHFCPTIANNPCGKDVPLFNLGDGSGIKQALWAGAAMQANGEHPPMMFWGATNCIKNILINKLGKRFIDETAGQSNMAAAQFNQPGATMFALWNTDYAEQLPAISYRADDPSWKATPEQFLAKWEDLAKDGLFMKAETLEQIAKEYELPIDALQETITKYNEDCVNGADTSFHKKPEELHELKAPYYATRYTVPASLASMGGLHVNAQSEVLDTEDKPLPGLYAVGLAAGDFYANQYSTRYAGSSLGRCMTFGYLVGRQLAGLN